jgi:hypothetical protein
MLRSVRRRAPAGSEPPAAGLLNADRRESIGSMSDAVIALIGVGVGAVLSAITALASPWLSARLARARFLEELELHRVDEVAAVMDDAALALERFHWSLRRSIDVIADDAAEPAELQRRLSAVDQAQDHASSFGSRLAIRLGPREQSELVSVYDDFQTGYRALADVVLTSAGKADATLLRSKLGQLADHDRYFEMALRTRAYLEQQGHLLRERRKA